LSIDTDLVSLELVGKAELPTTSKNDTQVCLVLASHDTENHPTPCLLVPLTKENSQLKPVQAAYAGLSLSSPVLWRLNTLLVNRDESLWDNLPWASWTIDPTKQNRDFAGNLLDPKFHLGKRDAYNVMMGKDWTFKSSSQAVSLLTKQLRDRQQQQQTAGVDKLPPGNDPHSMSSTNEEQSQGMLAQRLLELQAREMEMDIADLDYQLAVVERNNPEEVGTLEFQKEELLAGLESMKQQLQEFSLPIKKGEEEKKLAVTSNLIERVLQLVEKRKPAPYRGATGYAPYSPMNSKQEAKEFCSPYDMLVDIIQNQLNAEVIGCVLENTSILDTTALGGVIVLSRKTAKKEISLSGVMYTVGDEREDYGNDGVGGGETYVVECEIDEAVGMSLSCKVPLQVQSDIWQRSSIMAEPAMGSNSSNVLPIWRATDMELSMLVEGEARNQSITERVSPLRIPRTTSSLFDSIFQQKVTPSSNDPKELFPADNPIRSLDEFDTMSNPDKARTLLTMSNFQGRLPRPRAIRQAQSDNTLANPLDKLLIPLVDESVRRQYLIRDAELKGDNDLARELKNNRSDRQKAQEAAEQARALGQDDVAAQLEDEAMLLESLRADVTQDEGSYSRFLDRDDWYERERLKHAKRLDKKKFGSLLDGIE